MDFFKDRQLLDVGSGSGHIMTNANFEHTAKHSEDFRFTHCFYSNFRGTELSWNDISFVVSDIHLDAKELKEYTDEMCFELVLKHISATAMLKCIERVAYRARAEAVRRFKASVREMFDV
jgi:hypothetical protein